MDDYKKVAIDAAVSAGKLIMDLATREIKYEMKNAYDILSEADLKSEKLVVEKIKTSFPHHSILSEEMGEKNEEIQFLWVIDPIDGTINYARNIEEYCVSIALEKDGELILGVIYQPVYNLLYVAEKGMGAKLNGKTLLVSEEKDLINSIGSTENSSKLETRKKVLSILLNISDKIRGVRIIGSTALHLSKISAGKFDFFFKTRFNYWDVAAGVVLIREAGGIVTDFEGNDFSRKSTNIIASNKNLHPQLLEVLSNTEIN